MAFKIPPPYDPSRIYAIPEYMKEEGLTSRAMVTKWQPRGSYDNPDAFDPSWDKSYAVPEYVLAEGYGQGARVTEWLPRGYYDGDVRRANRIKRAQKALGDVTTPEPFAAYGRASAAVMLRKIGQLPAAARKDVLKKSMDKLDTSLYNKTARYAAEHERRGVPATQALELGIARAMSEGLGRELVDLGKRGGRPAAKGQVGLGAYGADALGAVTGVMATFQPAAPVLAPGTCSADGLSIWVQGASGEYFWRRRTAAEQCTATSTITPTTGGAAGGITGDSGHGVGPALTPAQLEAQRAASVAAGKWIDIGPVKLPLSRYILGYGHGPLPQGIQDLILQSITRDPDVDAVPGKIHGRLLDFIPSLPPRINSRFVGLDSERGTCLGTARQPFVVVQRPDNGEEWGLYLYIDAQDRWKPWDSATNPWVANIYWRRHEAQDQQFCNVFELIYAWIQRIKGVLIDVVKDVLDTVGNVACQVMSSEGAPAAAGAVAGAYGVPPQVGAQGAVSAQQACAGPLPPPAAGAGESMLPLIIAGGALAGIFLLTRKKKA